MQQMIIDPRTNEEMYNMGEVSEQLKISRTAINSRIKKLKLVGTPIPKFRQGNMVYIRKSDISKLNQLEPVKDDE
jgi:biotin operon repressor